MITTKTDVYSHIIDYNPYNMEGLSIIGKGSRNNHLNGYNNKSYHSSIHNTIQGNNIPYRDWETDRKSVV